MGTRGGEQPSPALAKILSKALWKQTPISTNLHPRTARDDLDAIQVVKTQLGLGSYLHSQYSLVRTHRRPSNKVIIVELQTRWPSLPGTRGYLGSVGTVWTASPADLWEVRLQLLAMEACSQVCCSPLFHPLFKIDTDGPLDNSQISVVLPIAMPYLIFIFMTYNSPARDCEQCAKANRPFDDPPYTI